MPAEEIKIVPYDPRWPEMFRQQADWLRLKFGADVILCIEHMGSTAVPGLCAKAIIDMLAEIASFEVGERIIVPVLQHEGWDYFWRDDRPPGHMMFIRRNAAGMRTHHLHMAPRNTSLWDRLAFRDYLRAHPDEAEGYADLKHTLIKAHASDREAYTAGKTEYVKRITTMALADRQ